MVVMVARSSARPVPEGGLTASFSMKENVFPRKPLLNVSFRRTCYRALLGQSTQEKVLKGNKSKDNAQKYVQAAQIFVHLQHLMVINSHEKFGRGVKHRAASLTLPSKLYSTY